MRQFFTRWQRGIGMLTLALACGLATAWLRSLRTVDLVQFGDRSQPTYGLASAAGVVGWFQWDRHNWFPLQQYTPSLATDSVWQAGPVELFFFSTFNSPFGFNYSWPCRLAIDQDLGPDRSRLDRDGLWGPHIIARGSMVIVPYWNFVIPLTALSAWLLLSRPSLARSASPD